MATIWHGARTGCSWNAENQFQIPDRDLTERRLASTLALPAAWRSAWTGSHMQGGPVDELLNVAVERPALDQLEVEVGRTLEDRFASGLTGDHREERHLDAVDQ